MYDWLVDLIFYFKYSNNTFEIQMTVNMSKAIIPIHAPNDSISSIHKRFLLIRSCASSIKFFSTIYNVNLL